MSGTSYGGAAPICCALALLAEDRERRSRLSEAATFRQKLDSLSAREREVMALMVQGGG